MADFPEDPQLVEADEPLDAGEALRRVEAAEDEFDAEDPLDLSEPLDDSDLLAIEDEVPPPPGKSYAFDFSRQAFMRRGSGVMPTYGMDTLRQRLQKILVQPRDAAPVAPDGYGLENAGAPYGLQSEELAASDLQRRIEEALLFDPLVAAVEDFELEVEPTSDVALVSFTVVLIPTEDGDTQEPQEIVVDGLQMPVG